MVGTESSMDPSLLDFEPNTLGQPEALPVRTRSSFYLGSWLRHPRDLPLLCPSFIFKLCPFHLASSTFNLTVCNVAWKMSLSWVIVLITLVCGISVVVFLIDNWWMGVQPNVAGSIFWAGDPGCIRKLGSKPASHALPWFLPWTPALISPNDELWPGCVSQIKPFFSAFVSVSTAMIKYHEQIPVGWRDYFGLSLSPSQQWGMAASTRHCSRNSQELMSWVASRK